jgi:hypothetical protein
MAEDMYDVFASIGSIAGVVAGVVFLITELFGPRDPSGKATRVKSGEFRDDL